MRALRPHLSPGRNVLIVVARQPPLRHPPALILLSRGLSRTLLLTLAVWPLLFLLLLLRLLAPCWGVRRRRPRSLRWRLVLRCLSSVAAGLVVLRLLSIGARCAPRSSAGRASMLHIGMSLMFTVMVVLFFLARTLKVICVALSRSLLLLVLPLPVLVLLVLRRTRLSSPRKA